MTKMLSFTIDDPITEPLTYGVEVTVLFQQGRKRWCFFMTPELLSRVGDRVKGTDVRFHLGAPHMIVVSELNEDVIRRVLTELDADNRLKEHTVSLTLEMHV